MSEAKWRQQQPPHSPKFLRKEKEKPLPKKGISKYFRFKQIFKNYTFFYLYFSEVNQ